jgi:hypothetical protein
MLSRTRPDPLPTPTRSEPVADTTDWRLIVESRARRVRADLATLAMAPGTDPYRTAAVEALAVVESTLRHRDRWWRVPVAWWSGSRVERCWRALHDAEVAVTAAEPNLAAKLPGLIERVALSLPECDLRRQALVALQPGVPPSDTDRTTLVDTLRAAFDVSDEVHAATRALRNKMVVAAVVLGVLNLSFGIVGALRPAFLPMCALSPDNNGRSICASGSGTPGAFDVWLVSLLGAAGASIATVVLLIRRRPSLSPYVLVGYQALIKVLLGAVLAVIGLLALGAGVTAGVTCFRAQATLLLWAVVLGYAQQLGTRLLDNYADRVLDRARPLTSEHH